MRNLDKFSGNRLRLGHDAFQTYDIKLLGQQISFVGNGLTADGRPVAGIYNYIDCFYEHILLRYGLVFFITVIICYTICAFIARKKRDYQMLVILTFLAVHAIIDDSILRLHINSFWFVIGEYLFYTVSTYKIKFEIKKYVGVMKKKGI